ncbi:hypothetical protein [Iodobacter fluviatilis]|uniref:Uncharacterized protein n=1 Tax=Iodobacter fluviatilis TaxID=537 RepID=A0A377Q644_9NEIS|nr:hypothetical protein [Iodobacter fluviatilis]TCU89374.1 hypothetical protein EV682_102286 [Iodobacter fluviatilis]STQ90744.1 Uncharacterised protein [Iodobacter fluviatilis]
MEDKERYQASVLYSNVADYETGGVRYIAHWLWWEGSKCISHPIGAECGSAGLEKNSSKHPDQVFWSQSRLIARPNSKAIIVTDCKILPCSKDGGCAYRVPLLIERVFGSGIPIGVFSHNDYYTKAGKFGYYTESGASQSDIDSAMGDIFTWDWDATSDGSTY